MSAPTPETMQRSRSTPQPICASDDEARAWANDWWTTYSPAAHDANLYLRPDGLYELLEGDPAPVKLLRLSWLLKRAEKLRRAGTDDERRALALPRRQDLEPAAFLSAEEVRALPRGHIGEDFETCGLAGLSSEDEADKPLRVISISHGWLTPEHPDPLGQQLIAFADQVEQERRMFKGDHPCFMRFSFFLAGGFAFGTIAWCIPHAGQQCCHVTHQLPSGELGVFYDFGSLMQKDANGERTPTERAAFAAALQTMGVWYAHRLTTTVIMSHLPAGWPRTEADAPFFPPGWLKAKGWPIFERSVSNQIKAAGGVNGMVSTTWRRVIDPDGLADGVHAYREPPVHPRDFAAKLARAVFTNGRSDTELVAGLYADTFAGAFGRVRKLSFRFAEWGDDEAEALARVLAFATSATGLDLSGNDEIGARGIHALADAIESGAPPALRAFTFHSESVLGGWGVSSPKQAALKRLRDACAARGVGFLGFGRRS